MEKNSDFNDKEEFDKEQFDRTANDSKLWVMRAEDLHTASQVLRDKVTSLKCDIENDLAGAVCDMKYVGLIFQSAMLQHCHPVKTC